MLGAFLASAAFGFVKGWSTPGASPGDDRFRAEQDFYGPVREELIYRAAPLWAFPNLPFGTTAVTFAAEHIISDSRHGPMGARDVVARFGDVMLGGILYESAMRSSGVLGAIAAHIAHNVAVGFGARARRRGAAYAR